MPAPGSGSGDQVADAAPGTLPQLAAELEKPLRSPEVELVGPMQDMAYKDGRWLICVGGSQYIQATKRLYHVLLHADGQTPIETIADRVTADIGSEVTPEQIRWLIANRLATSGLLVVGRNGNAAAAGRIRPPEAPILGIRHRLPLIPYRVSAPIAAALQLLYWPPIVLVLLVSAAAVNVWVYESPDLLRSLRSVLYEPQLVLFLFALDILTRVFHEFGHASALRRGGARWGDIGFALYIIFPVWYTDVTHSYRLNRLQRIRVDLGGMYFDCISMLGLFGAYELTGYRPLLLMIVLIGLTMLRQFTPFIRFDGYYLIADVIGVHEPLTFLAAVIREKMPWTRRGLELPALGRFARVALAAYLVLIIGFLARPALILAVAGGALLAEIPRSGLFVWQNFLVAWQHHDVVAQLAATLNLLFWLFIPLGLALFVTSLAKLLFRILRALARLAWRHLRSALSGPADEAEERYATPPVSQPGPVAPAAPAAAVPAPPPVSPTPAPAAPPLPTPMTALLRPVEATPGQSPLGENPLGEVDKLLEQLRSRYAAELQHLSEGIASVYEEKLRTQSTEMAQLRARAERAEKERALLEERLQTLEFSIVKHSADLRRLGEEFIARAQAAERERDAARDALKGAS